MKQQYLKYDPLTGNITEENGTHIFYMLGCVGIEVEEKNKSTSIDDMIKLKNSGFTAEEVIAIKKANL